MSNGADMIRAVVAKHGKPMAAFVESYADGLRRQAQENPLFAAALVIVSEELIDAAQAVARNFARFLRRERDRMAAVVLASALVSAETRAATEQNA